MLNNTVYQHQLNLNAVNKINSAFYRRIRLFKTIFGILSLILELVTLCSYLNCFISSTITAHLTLRELKDYPLFSLITPQKFATISPIDKRTKRFYESVITNLLFHFNLTMSYIFLLYYSELQVS